MQDEDHLFVRCLMVVLTVVGGFLSMLVLSPGPGQGLPDGEPGAEAPAPTVRARWVRTAFSLPSAGPRPAPAPVQSGDSALAFARLLAQEALEPPAPPRTGRDRAQVAAASVLSGPVLELALDGQGDRDTPFARRLAEETRGDEPATPPPWGLGLRTHRVAAVALPPDVMPALKEMAPVEIIVRRVAAIPRQEAPLRGQDLDDDPLPEFRRFLPRVQVCVAQARKRGGVPVDGKVVLRFTVDPDGWVREARAVGGTLSDPDARACVESMLTRDRFFDRRPVAVQAERAVIVAR
ncbi:MAG: hypothetical protein HY904_12805 [Deltaproteobacteria bacterium]|nr:hypothetical protein [Deltaproteobacteria bacterium]